MVKKVLWALLLIILLGLFGIGVMLYAWVDNAFTPPENGPQSQLFEAHKPKTSGITARELPDELTPSDSFNIDALINLQDKYRPWTRWWWPGGLVEDQALREQLRDIKNAGFGGVEIQAFSMGTRGMLSDDELKQLRTFATPEFDARVAEFIRYAKSIDMKVDLTNGSGWPAGGPHIGIENGLQTLNFGHLIISNTDNEPKQKSIAVPRAKPNANDYGNLIMEALFQSDIANFDNTNSELIALLAAPYDSGSLSINPFTIDDSIQLKDAATIDLFANYQTSNDKSAIRWEVPPGEWVIIAIYQQAAGEAPVLSANPSAGYIVDHLNQAVLEKHYDFTLANALYKPLLGNGIHGVFNDSLEFKLNRMSADDFLEEFEKRRGYDLRPHLPFVFFDGADNFYLTDSFIKFSAAPSFSRNDLDKRIRYDYQQTLSDLITERFIQGSAQWLGRRGVTSRAQSYGMDIDIIRGLGANHIPETEQLYAGGSDNFLKMTGAAAALYGRNIATAESFVWQGKDLQSSPWKLKVAADKLFAAGINRVIYHGTTYQLGEDKGRFGPTNWYPWSSPGSPLTFGTNVSKNTPLWQSADELNAYFTRVQSVLQQGKPSYDVFIYYPFLGVPSAHERDITSDPETLLAGHVGDLEALPPGIENPINELLFDAPPPDARNLWFDSIKGLIYELEAAGLTWTWTNADAMLKGADVLNNKPVIFANVDAVPLEFAELLSNRAPPFKALVFGDAPHVQESFHGATQGDTLVEQSFAKLSKFEQTSTLTDYISAQDRQTRISIVVDETQASLQNESGKYFPIKQMHRRFNGGQAIFISNMASQDATVAIDYTGNHANNYASNHADNKKLVWYSPSSGKLYEGEDQKSDFDLLPYESLIALILNESFSISDLVELEPAQNTLVSTLKALTLDWSWRYSDSENTLKLTEARDIATYDTVVYQSEFTLDDSAQFSFALLHTPRFVGHAQIYLNGQAVDEWVLPPYQTDLVEYLQVGKNTLEIHADVPWFNAMLQDYKSGDQSVKQLSNRESAVAVGIVDEVQLLIK